MKRKRKLSGFIAFALFVVVIVASGFALKAADYIDSPFDDIAFTSQWANGGEQQLADALGQSAEPFTLETPAANSSSTTGVDLTSLSDSDSQFQLPPPDSAADDSLGTDTGFNGAPDQENSIAWSDIGGVFYDLWFIGAVTACFIAVQYIFKFSIKQIKGRMSLAAAK
jgi:hypothetical protein